MDERTRGLCGLVGTAGHDWLSRMLSITMHQLIVLKIMHRRSLTALLLAALLVLAGCTGTTDPATTVAESETAQTPTATAEPTSEPTSEPTPEPVVEPGEIDPKAVADGHVAALRDAGSFTVRKSTSIDAENESAMQDVFGDAFSVSQTVRVDLDTGRGMQVNEAFGTERATYADFEENRTFVRITDGEGNVTSHSYDAVGSPFESPVENRTGRAYGDLVIEEWLTKIDFTVVGVESIDGEYVTRLEADGADNHGEVAVWNDSVYERMHTTMLIDEDGVVREIHHEQTSNLTGDPMDATMTYRWTDVGSTDVSEPAWLDEAKEATNGATRTTNETTAARRVGEFETDVRVVGR